MSDVLAECLPTTVSLTLLQNIYCGYKINLCQQFLIEKWCSTQHVSGSYFPCSMQSTSPKVSHFSTRTCSFCFQLIFFVTLKCDLDWNYERDCIFVIRSSEGFSVESADKPLIHLWKGWQTCQKQAQGQRPNFVQTAVYPPPPRTRWIQENRQVFITLYTQNKTPFTNWKLFFLLSWMSP